MTRRHRKKKTSVRILSPMGRCQNTFDFIYDLLMNQKYKIGFAPYILEKCSLDKTHEKRTFYVANQLQIRLGVIFKMMLNRSKLPFVI